MNSKAIIYDDSCPLCCWYTNLFIQKGWLNQKGRISFSELEEPYLSLIDPQKSKHYIPYVDVENSKVWYGPEALVQILKSNFPLLEKLYNIAVLKKLAYIAYNFISYNRRVIAAKQAGICNFNCTPEFNKSWRMAYIVFATIIAAAIFKSIIPMFVFSMLIIFAYFFGAAFMFPNKKERQYTFMGYLTTTLLIVALLYLPFKIISAFLGLPVVMYCGLVIASIVSIVEFKRRLALL